MKKNGKIILTICVVIVLVIGISLFFAIRNYMSINSDKKALSYLVSDKTHSYRADEDEDLTEINDYYEKINEFLSKYCSEQCIENYLINYMPSNNNIFVDKYKIVKTDNISVKLLTERADSENRSIKYREYQISYTYIDENNIEYNITDFYNIYKNGNEINKIILILKKSDIVKKANQI